MDATNKFTVTTNSRGFYFILDGDKEAVEFKDRAWTTEKAAVAAITAHLELATSNKEAAKETIVE